MRDGDFDKQLHERLELAGREKRDAIALAEAKLEAGETSAASTSFDVDAFLKTKRQKLAGIAGNYAATQ